MKKTIKVVFSAIALLLLAVMISSCTGSENYAEDFAIEGKWKNVGDTGFGQAQPGAIIVFDGANCNFFSPQDTYAFTSNEDGAFKLEVTGYMSPETLSFNVDVQDYDHITIGSGDTLTELERVE